MKKLNKKGFTLIEVVLVLAIGGLIFLLAFIAFQQVSRNRRDTQRRSDAGRIVAEIQNFKGDKGSTAIVITQASTGSSSANSGLCSSAATNGSGFGDYLCDKNGLFPSPSGGNYSTVTHNSTTPLSKDQVKISTSIGLLGVVAKDCSDNDLPDGGFRVEIGLESSGATVCKDSR